MSRPGSSTSMRMTPGSIPVTARSVRSVTGIDPGVILIDVEDPGLDIAHQRGESLTVALDVPDTARKERVTCPDVSVPDHIVVDQCDRSRRVPTQVDDVQG